MMGSMMRRAMIGDSATLNVDFTSMTNGGQLANAGFTFTNATTAARTYINASGIVATATTNEPRFDHDPTTLAPRGLLIEGTATSLSRSSQNLTDAAYWTLQTAYASTSATGGTAPDGTNTGNLFTEPSSNLQRSIYQSYSSAAGTYTFSVWLKAGSGSTRYMRLVVASGAGDFGYVTVNMSTGAIQQAATVVGTATNASATVSGNYTATGWRRYSLTVTLAASVNFVFLVPTDLASIDTPTTNYGRVSYLGDGSSFLIWGAQLEAGSGASSYIPTTNSTATRNADECSMTGTNFSSWYNQSEGTILCFHAGRTSGAAGRAVEINNNSSAERIVLSTDSTSATYLISDNGSVQVNQSRNAFAGSIAKRYAAAYSANNFAVSFNGAAALTDNSGTLPTVDRMWVGQTNTGLFLDSTISRIAYWPTRLPDATLQSLTT